MTAVTLGATLLLECPVCDGLWADAQAFERLCADGEAQAAVLHRPASRAAAADIRVSYRPCLQCGTMMNRVNFARLSGTVVDVCKGHGTFLDAGELQAIIRFIQAGGLELARQRQLEDLKDQERRLREQQARVSGAGYSSSSGRLRSPFSWTRSSRATTLDSVLDLFNG